jgi:hypothetical protein
VAWCTYAFKNKLRHVGPQAQAHAPKPLILFFFQNRRWLENQANYFFTQKLNFQPISTYKHIKNSLITPTKLILQLKKPQKWFKNTKSG